jgi:hypothetical protein
MSERTIPANFLQYAASILADTQDGLTGAKIIEAMNGYSIDFEVDIPHTTYPFEAQSKRAALNENLAKFNPSQQYQIIKELCDHVAFQAKPNPKVKDLKVRLITRYELFDVSDSAFEINETLIEETRHWLNGYPNALRLYNEAFEKLGHGVFHRNLLDDLRLSLEKLLHEVLKNDKSLENQISYIGKYISNRGGSKEFTNMFMKLVDYYTTYQNSYVKHDDAVIEEEIEFIFEITSSFMKHLIRRSSAP